MAPRRFGTITRFFARNRLNRRAALDGSSARLVATSFAGFGAATAAHEATPMPSGDNDTGGPEMLFVQSFESGSVTPKAGENGRYTVTLEHGLGQTIYFSDRPNRIVGTRPTQRFLDGLGFALDTPPNAAILTANDTGESTIAVVELFDPVYDPDSATVTYEMAMLEHWQRSTELGLAEASVDLDAVGATFESAHLFIDGCPTREIYCVSAQGVLAGTIDASHFGGYCYSPMDDCCLPWTPWYDTISSSEKYWTAACNEIFPNCGGMCSPSGVYVVDTSPQQHRQPRASDPERPTRGTRT